MCSQDQVPSPSTVKVSQKSIMQVFYVTFEVVEDDLYFLFHVCSDLRTCWAGKVSMKILVDD